MNIEVAPLNIEGMEHGMVVRTNDDLEIQYSSPRSSPVQGAHRRLWSTRAASLMDGQEEEDDDDEEGIADLEGLTDEEQTHSSDSSNSENDKSLMAFSKMSFPEEDDGYHAASHSEDEIEKPSSSLARLSENISGIATYLCASNFEKDVDTVRYQTSKALSKRKTRRGSGTDTFQRMVSYGPCGTNSIFTSNGSSERSASTIQSSPSIAPLSPPPATKGTCSTLGILDLRQNLISDISMILGSTTESSEGWICTGKGWPVARRARTSLRGQKRVRNRCALPHAQSRRMRQLWYQWHSHSADTNEMQADFNQNVSKVNRSLDDINVRSDRTSSPPVAFVDLYYDSDPEIFATTHRSRMSRKHAPDTINPDASFGSAIHTPPDAPTAAYRTRGCSFDTRASISKSFSTIASSDADETNEPFDLWDDQKVKGFVKDLTFGKINLVWHRSTKGDNQSNSSSSKVGSPVSVKGWFETGSRLQKTLIHPKFMWRETFQPDIVNRKLSMSCRAPASLDLLTMIRILKSNDIDRTIYPYAKPDHCFSIKNHNGETYLFEAGSTRERDWFVHGLKLLVARLASMIIVGDDQMFQEFFSPWAYTPLQVQQFCADGEKEKDAESNGQPSASPSETKPFYASTTEKDREELWGNKTATS